MHQTSIRYYNHRFLPWDNATRIKVGRALQNDEPPDECSTDRFQSVALVAVAANRSLVNDAELEIFGIAFADTFNDLNDVGGGGGQQCDPLFRQISNVEVSANVTFSGSNEGEFAEPPFSLTPARRRRWLQQSAETEDETDAIFATTPRGISLILIDIFGWCRGCTGSGTRDVDLFDDSSNANDTPNANGGGRQRRLQADSCQCSDDSRIPGVNTRSFELSFNDTIGDLRNSGQLNFAQEIEDVIPVTETTCPTNNEKFTSVYKVAIEETISAAILLQQQVKTQLESLAKESYNGIAQQLCDPLYRSVAGAEFISLLPPRRANQPGSRLEFLFEGECKGECSESANI